ncbi:hypothetical protein P280DRAFT_168391 [Massarina eburnea CBS 473.64]|uniref:Uncharacterized protein n=1 Tax=Massarina eburnea CBS 473.64 TaxID=1395130 RepID=A0A6A6RNP9_9PLEO|nr:hypothetical protein P280DRAFT_168391 [Massarina eburnea CBS 473.64]
MLSSHPSLHPLPGAGWLRAIDERNSCLNQTPTLLLRDVYLLLCLPLCILPHLCSFSSRLGCMMNDKELSSAYASPVPPVPPCSVCIELYIYQVPSI